MNTFISNSDDSRGAVKSRSKTAKEPLVLSAGFQKRMQAVVLRRGESGEDGETLFAVAEAAVRVAWEAARDQLCNGDSLSLDELGSMATVVQRLTSAFSSLSLTQMRLGNAASPEASTGEADEETSGDPLQDWILPGRVVREVESRLKLL